MAAEYIGLAELHYVLPCMSSGAIILLRPSTTASVNPSLSDALRADVPKTLRGQGVDASRFYIDTCSDKNSAAAAMLSEANVTVTAVVTTAFL